jgi:nucleotide-binding universal stress UspA family protein
LLVRAAAIALHDRDVAKRSAEELRAFIDATFPDGATEVSCAMPLVSVGRPSDEIIKAAGRRKADLIVMGTHGLTGADRVLMGSTTLAVLQRTAVPVLAVPRSAVTPAAVATDWPGSNILVPVELDDASGSDLDVAVELARWWHTSLLLVHVIDDIDAAAWAASDLAAHDRIRVCQAQRRINELAVASRRRVPTRARVVCGRPPDEIAAVAAAEGSGLVVTALRDRRGWLGSKRGGVSYQVLSHAVTPVLARPPQWRPR